MALSHQNDPDNARIKREVDAELLTIKQRLKEAEQRLDDADTFETYVRDELVPYIADLAVFVAYATAPPEPPP